MTRTPYQRLGDAQEAAARAGRSAPCTWAPKLWTSEQMPRYQLLDLIRACQFCPVLVECLAYKDDAARRGLALTGVVAGEVLTMGQRSPLPRPAGDAVGDRRLGTVSLAQAVAWMEQGYSYAEIGRLAGVRTTSVHNAFRRLRERMERMERVA